MPYIYKIQRAFTDAGNKLYELDKDITESEYERLGVNQAFVKKIFSGTQEELDAILAKEDKKDNSETEINLDQQSEQLIADKEILIKEYTDLFGEEPDKRWSFDTLKQKLEDKLKE